MFNNTPRPATLPAFSLRIQRSPERGAAPEGVASRRKAPPPHDRIRSMIKGISILRRAEDGAVYERLSSFFAAMGFAKGSGWKEPVSAGASFLAPLGNLEFVHGQFPSVSDVMVEVTSLDAAYQAAERWLLANGEIDAVRAAIDGAVKTPTGKRASLLSSRSPDLLSHSGRGQIR